MAALVPTDKVKDKEYSNWLKVTLALYYMKSGLHTFIKSEVDRLHQSLVQKIYGRNTVPLPPCTMCQASHVQRNKFTGVWTFPKHCKSYCYVWLHEMLKLHTNPKSERIYWENSHVASWPFRPWECAKVFMSGRQPPSSVGPTECDAQAMLTLLANCTHFHNRFSLQGLNLTHTISAIRNKVMHDSEMKLSDADRVTYIQQIIQFLEDPVCLKSIDDCKAAVVNIQKIKNDSLDVFFNLDTEMTGLRSALNELRLEHGSQGITTLSTVYSLKEECKQFQKQIRMCFEDVEMKMDLIGTNVQAQKEVAQEQQYEIEKVEVKVEDICSKVDSIERSIQLVKEQTDMALQQQEIKHQKMLEMVTAHMVRLDAVEGNIHSFGREIHEVKTHKLTEKGNNYGREREVAGDGISEYITSDTHVKKIPETAGQGELKEKSYVWNFTVKELLEAWPSVKNYLLEELAPKNILPFLEKKSLLSAKDGEYLFTLSRRQVAEQLLQRIREKLPEAFSSFLLALKETKQAVISHWLKQQIEGIHDPQPVNLYQETNVMVPSISYYVLKLELLKDGNKLHEAESKTRRFLSEGCIVFDYEMKSQCMKWEHGSIIVYLQPLNNTMKETLEFFCRHGGMTNFVLDLLKKKDIFSYLPEGKMSIHVQVQCHDEDPELKGTAGQWRHNIQIKDQHVCSQLHCFTLEDNPQVIRENILSQYSYVLEEIEPLQFEETFVSKGFWDSRYFEQLKVLRTRRERARRFLEDVMAEGNTALEAVLCALRHSGLLDLTHRLCTVNEITPQYRSEDHVDDSLIEVIEEYSANNEEPVLWSRQLVVAVRWNEDGTRSKEDPNESISPSSEGVVANEEAIAIEVQEPLAGSNTGRSLNDNFLESQDRRVDSIFKPTRMQTVSYPNNPRSIKIIKLSFNEMRDLIGEEISKGAYGTVYKAKKFKDVKLECVIKEIKFTDEDKAFQKSYDREVYSGRILHPFINPIIACAESPIDASPQRASYLMFRFMVNGDLRHNIDRENGKEVFCPPKPNSIIWTRCVYQIVQAMDYLHNPVPFVRGPIFHRDLKSRNIFLDENFNVRIGDFGISVEAKFNATHVTETSRPCTEGYHPPNRDPQYNATYDVFSMGVVMLEILTGKEAKLDEGFLYDKYPRNRGFTHLMHDLKTRADENKAAAWSSARHRNALAKIALRAVNLVEKERKEVNLFKCLEDLKTEAQSNERMLRIETNQEKELRTKLEKNKMKAQVLRSNLTSEEEQKYSKYIHKAQDLEKKLVDLTIENGKRETALKDNQLWGDGCYQKPVKLDRCVLCCINPIADLSLRGDECAESGSKCKLFCVPCLTINHINPLVCPEHGKTRPPLGDHVYGVFVAGNDVKGIKTEQRSYSPKEAAEIFIGDVDKIVKVLTAKYPLILGADAKHFKVVKPATPGTETQMDENIRQSFTQIRDMIENALEENKLDINKDRIPGSLFIFYFSGHCDKEDGLMLGGEEERINATTEWIKEMLHNDLGVDNVLVILDCCHADSIKFADAKGLNEEQRITKASFFRLSACETEQKISLDDQGSYFTSILWQGLKGFHRKVSEDGIIQYCKICNGPFQYCNHCEEKIKHTLEEINPDTTLKCYHCERMQIGANNTVPCMDFHDKWTNAQYVTTSSLQDFVQAHFRLLGYRYNTVSDTLKNGDKIVVAYYNPDKPCISVYLTDSTKSDNSDQKAYNFSMDCLKQDLNTIKEDLINYTVDNELKCDLLTFHQSYGQSVQDSSRLAAIYPKDGKDKDKELTTLDSIFNVWSTARDLEVRVRENIKGFPSAPVKFPVVLRTITKSMAKTFEAGYNTDYLKISQDIIKIPLGQISEAEMKILEMSESTEHNEDFRNLMDKLSAALRNLQIHEEDKEKDSLSFNLCEQFSIVEIN